jgi:hypothetical protein
MATVATGSDTFAAAVEHFLGEQQSLFIDGRAMKAQGGRTFTTLDPGSGQTLAEIPSAGPEDIDLAVEAAAKAFRGSNWARMTPNERGVYRRVITTDDDLGLPQQKTGLHASVGLPPGSNSVLTTDRQFLRRQQENNGGWCS